jgi:4-hydroxy-tetrahydrodipicolinate synthase
MITGSIVAVVTPMNEDGGLDYACLRGLVDFHVAEGTDGMVIVGTSGESPTVNVDEHCELIRVAVEHAAGRIPVIAGTGANSTAEAIELARFAQKAGADAHLSVVPYYNKPTQEGLYRHFRAIAEAVPLPLILYNVPGRTGTNTRPEVFEAVAGEKNIVAVKEASGNLEQAHAIKAKTRLTVLSGDDALTLPMIAVGAAGIISVAGNAAPAPMRELTDHARAGRMRQAEAVHARLMPLFHALFVESNPGPVKFLLAAMGLIDNELRLPLVPVEPATEQLVRSAAQASGLPLGAAARA